LVFAKMLQKQHVAEVDEMSCNKIKRQCAQGFRHGEYSWERDFRVPAQTVQNGRFVPKCSKIPENRKISHDA